MLASRDPTGRTPVGGHEIPTALLPNLLTATLGAPAAALGLIEGVADGLAGAARLAGGAIADDLQRRRAQAVARRWIAPFLASFPDVHKGRRLRTRAATCPAVVINLC
jgi:hypothetical protein